MTTDRIRLLCHVSVAYEVTSDGRSRYLIDGQARIVWLVYASPRHPKDTDR